MTVRNSAPSAPVVSIDPVDPVAGDTLVCNIDTDATDADGDAITYSFSWTQDGAAFGSAGRTYETGDTVAGTYVQDDETWVCSVTAGDGSAVASATIQSVTSRSPCAALVFDGLDDYVSFDGLVMNDSDFTIEAWMMFDNLSDGTGTIISWGRSAPVLAFSKYWTSGTDRDNFLSIQEAGLNNVTSYGAYVSATAWHHVAVTHRATAGWVAGAYTFFVDGLSYTSNWLAGVPLIYPTSGSGYVGREQGHYGTTHYLAGTIDSLRVSDSIRYTTAFAPEDLLDTDIHTRALC